MAKGDVVMKFDGETAAFLQKVMQAAEAMQGAASHARDFGKHTAEAGDAAHAGLHKAAEGAGELITSFTGVAAGLDLIEKGVESVGKIFEDYMERMKKKAEELLHKTIELNTSLGGAGQNAAGPQVNKALEEMGQMRIGRMDVSGKEATEMYASISRATKASADMKRDATLAGQYGMAAGMNQQDATALGINYVNIAKQEGMEGMSAEALADMAYNATTNLGGEMSQKDLRFLGRSTDKQQALKLIEAAARSDESAKGLTKLQAEADKAGSPEEAQKRLNAILANPDLAGPEDRRAVQNLVRGMNQLPAQLSLNREVQNEQYSSDPNVSRYFDTHNTDVYVERKLEKDADDAVRQQNLKKQFEADHPVLHSLPVAGWAADRVIEGMEDATAHGAYWKSHGISIQTDPGQGAPAQNNINDTLKDIHGTLRSIDSKTAPNHDLQSNKPGAQ